MLIVSGWLRVDPDGRDAFLTDCVAVVAAAREAPGCLDFAMGADLVDPGRVNVHERWQDENDLLAFRGSGPSGDQQVAILDAEVKRYEASSEAPA